MSLIGKKVGDFKLQAYYKDEFKTYSQEDLRGKWSVLFFYPADFTFVCPTELEDLADMYSQFQEINCDIYSVSTDSHFVHKAWHDVSERVKKVQYPMLADPTGQLTRALEVYIEDSGMAERGTFVINPEGEIVLYEVNGGGIGRNAEELLRKVQAAQFVAVHGDEV